ncbi:gliding motility lipoprotein GldB [Croceivirga thetidis]|uniref:Gliding motility lipoprotein GldB n=1 Tax=Croceivirga thetidis TaxID=2721623 RepID=A0ABX1GND5_9FLAO|nr:gliding motility lipoprotein GldB [Croceivirga thetidis]NKI30465.1 gliding motility lipoprotein GldB [Croceivirga thetidis]
MKLIHQYFPIIVLIFLISSCKNNQKIKEQIAQIDVELTVSRFDREFAEAKVEDLPELKTTYPYLFPSRFSDSLWISKMNDTLQMELEQEVELVFPSFESEQESLESLFRHITYYFPEFTAPSIVTLISEVDYNNRVVYSDSLLLIGLDNYLGQDHKFYSGLPNYVAKGLSKDFLTSDVASTFAKKVLSYPRNRSFLSRMVHYGKELYLKDKLLPELTDAQKLNYLEGEHEWALANEEQMWRYFVENELLYSTDSSLDRKFLDPAPFSKFGLELDSESPGRLGRFLGWQIVRAYAEKHPEADLNAVLQLPADELFKMANYKPKR